jgi:hypothetical protein
MSEKFKAIIIDNQNEKFTREIKEIDYISFKRWECSCKS